MIQASQIKISTNYSASLQCIHTMQFCHDSRKIVLVKSKKQNASNVTPLYNDQDVLCCDPLAKSNILGRHFQSVFTNEDFSTMSRLNRSSFLTMSHVTIDASGVENLLRKLNPHKATGPDAIPAQPLCELSAEVAPVLTFVFHMSLDTGKIPGDWHMAYIVPFYKRRDKCSEKYITCSLT